MSGKKTDPVLQRFLERYIESGGAARKANLHYVFGDSTGRHRPVDPVLRDFITDYLMVETPLKKADIGFIFGNKYRSDLIADQAAKLYHAGYFDKLIVSGGVSCENGQTEANYIAALLMEKKVPARAILRENKATNTGENVRFSLPILDKEIGLDKIGSVIAIGKVYAARRYLMTLERWLPGRELISAPVNDFLATEKQHWDRHPRFSRVVREQIRRIPDYMEKDFLASVQIRDRINTASEARSGKESQNPRKPKSDSAPDIKP